MFGTQKGFWEQEKGRMPIWAPLAGEVVSIREVSDPAFGEEVLGKGVAIRPTTGRVVSPFKGTVTQIFDTGHAVSLTSDDGVELLIHIGLDTVRLKGEHYTPRIRKGQRVDPGDVLIDFDRAGISAAGFDTITPIVICNSHAFENFEIFTGKAAEGDTIMILSKK